MSRLRSIDVNTKSFGPNAKWQRQLKDCLNRIYIGNEVMYTFGIKSLVGNITCNKLREKNIYILAFLTRYVIGDFSKITQKMLSG